MWEIDSGFKNMATFEENKLDYWKALKLISVDVSKQNMVK